MSGISKILLVRMGALGDVLHALPAQQLLAREMPGARIHWLSEAAYVPLLHCVSGIEQIWTADTKRWRQGPLHWEGFPRLVRGLRRQRFDLAVDFHGLFKSALLTWLSGARRLLGFRPERFKEKGCDWFYSKKVDGEADLNRHVIETNLRLISELVPDAKASARIELDIPSEDQAYVHRQLSILGLGNEAPVLINPGAGWPTKMWPAAHFGELSLEIENRLGHPVVFCFGPGEGYLIERIRKVRGSRPTFAFPSTIVQLAELCKRGRLMIGGDSGPIHLAVAVGTPVVAILGPTAPRRNGPAGPRDLVVKRDLPCSDSYKRRCDEWICMDIAVERVLSAVEARLERPAAAEQLPVLS